VYTYINGAGIFKVETIGDSYVAVCGLPEANRHHALKMAKFASLCVEEMTTITKRLELSLGPGTTDLALRLGLHSGPTIAGVLRGEKARFQLFGDTVSKVEPIYHFDIVLLYLSNKFFELPNSIRSTLQVEWSLPLGRTKSKFHKKLQN
jgi:hypothetical protein